MHVRTCILLCISGVFFFFVCKILIQNRVYVCRGRFLLSISRALSPDWRNLFGRPNVFSGYKRNGVRKACAPRKMVKRVAAFTAQHGTARHGATRRGTTTRIQGEQKCISIYGNEREHALPRGHVLSYPTTVLRDSARWWLSNLACKARIAGHAN